MSARAGKEIPNAEWRVLVLGDKGNWIDQVVEQAFVGAVRILDWTHDRDTYMIAPGLGTGWRSRTKVRLAQSSGKVAVAQGQRWQR